MRFSASSAPDRSENDYIKSYRATRAVRFRPDVGANSTARVREYPGQGRRPVSGRRAAALARTGATQGCTLREAGRGPRLRPLTTYGGHSSEEQRAPNRVSGRVSLLMCKRRHIGVQRKAKNRSVRPLMNCMLLSNL